MYHDILQFVNRIKEEKPLILNITNDVTMDFVANGLLSLGASPMMTTAEHEIEDLVNIALAVVINIGTLNDAFISLCSKACQKANELGKPIIFDPVGAGANRYRTQTCLDILERYKVDIIRGNASEVLALCGAQHNTKGVDSIALTIDSIGPAQKYASMSESLLIISGQTDAVIQGQNVSLLSRGSAMMPMITGSGCLLTSIIAAFHSVSEDSFKASCAGVAFYGVCGELAAHQAAGPGTFKAHFLDALSQLPNRDDYETI